MSDEKLGQIRTILVPLDGSPRAETILPYVEDLAATHNAKVILLQVVEPTAYMRGPYDMAPYFDTDMAQRIVDEANAYMAAKRDEYKAKGIEVEALLIQGSVVRAILEVAEQKNVSLIAMASHGRTGVGRVFYGSVAAGVLHSTQSPLLLVRAMSE
jgi:nucleotide-binding universal stress UspA family protein